MRISHYDNLVLYHANRVARIYRGQDRVTGDNVVVKIANTGKGNDTLSLFQYDYQLSESTPAPQRLEALAIRDLGDHRVAIFRDPGGDTIERWACRPDWPLQQRLGLAIRLTELLDQVHREGLIHKNVSPGNVLFNAATRELCLLDYSLSTRLSREEAGLTNFGVVDGDPAYCAPEQTGRMNRNIDTRSDYYALGATLYHLFTGTPPFSMTAPMELVHAHIAMMPEAPQSRSSEIPDVLGNAILKLLQKAPEERYQSLEGLRHDLERIAREMSETGQAENFPLGEKDYTAVFHIPQHLYGRESAELELMNGFEEASRGQEAITMVAGPSGIGKTAVIRALYQPITARHAYFVSGKFDVLQRERPYTALAEALQQLFRDVLSEPEECLERWRQDLQTAVGENGGLLTPLIPELESIIGPQSFLNYLEADENSRVFRRIMLRIIRLFCSPERPLVLYLDDLQWADRASLYLLGTLARELASEHFYLIGAYRDNEITASHALTELLEKLSGGQARFRSITLAPLDESAIVRLLADTLAQPPEAVDDLARGILRKTGGVPFFIHQSLESLYRNGLIVFDRKLQSWQLSLESLDTLPATDDQLDWMANQIRQFEPGSQTLLQSAACLGSQFDLSWLAKLEQISLTELMNRLEAPLDAGLVSVFRRAAISTSDNPNAVVPENTVLIGRFAHDRIQQAAYSLLDREAQQQRHWAMGQLLLRENTEEQQQLRLFEIVHHLNLGRTEDCDPDTRWHLAKLNRRAGEKARNSAAHNASFSFYSEGIGVLPPDAWQQDYPLTLDLYEGALQAAFLSHRYDIMDQLGKVIQDNARDLLDTKTVYSTRIHAFNIQNQLDQAIRAALSFLHKLDVRFPARPNTGHILLSLAQTQLQLRGQTIDDIRNIPEMTDPRQLAIMETMHRMASSAYFAAPMLHPLLVLKMVRLAARYGHAPAYTVAYAPYGIVLCGVLHNYERGFAFGELSLEFAQHPRARPLKCRTTVLVYTFVWHWKRYAGESIDVFRQAYEEGLETGDHEYAAYACVLKIVNSLFVGSKLDDLATMTARSMDDIARLSAGTAYTFLRVNAQMITNLREAPGEPWRLTGQYADEDSLALECGEDRTGLCCLRTAQMMMCYRFGRLKEAMERLAEVDLLSDATRGMLVSADHHFYGALIRIASYADSASTPGPRLRWNIRQHRKMLAGWAESAPVNFLHKQQLVEAEWHRVCGRVAEALQGYEQAISTARNHGFLHDQALAEELAGRFCANQALDKMALTFREDALSHYQQWGAIALAERLQTDDLPGRESSDDQSADWGASQMDLAAFKTALKAISQSGIHSDMMEAVIRAAVTFAGAQSGQLLLARPDHQLYVEARWNVNDDQPTIFQATPLDQADNLCQPVAHYVRRLSVNLVIDDAQKPQSVLPHLHTDPDVITRHVRSILCVPLVGGNDQSGIVGILYLENNATPGAFTPQRLETLEIICLAAAGRLELSRKAVTDGLTNLYNHEYFQTILETEIHLAQRRKRDLSLIMLDIDHFKNFNDQWGHQLGDEVLKKVAQTMQDVCRGSDIAARCGGEEFAVILPDTSLSEAREAAERLRATISNSRFMHNGEALSLTVSLGVAQLSADMGDRTSLIGRADENLYAAKHAGRNCVIG